MSSSTMQHLANLDLGGEGYEPVFMGEQRSDHVAGYYSGSAAHAVGAGSSSESQEALTTVTTEHYTRNLVGAAVTSANVLKDEQDVFRIFFVLQDLSIRTEGIYRIRLLFTILASR